MHERSHWRSILAQLSPKSVIPTKQICMAERSLVNFAPSSGSNYARVLCIFHERPLDITTPPDWNRFLVLFASKQIAKTWRFRRFSGIPGGEKARAAVRWFPGGGWATRTPRVRRPRRSCPRPCTPSRPSIEPPAKRPATTIASPSGAAFWLRMTFLLVRSAPTRWRRVSAQGCLPPVRDGSNYKVRATPWRRSHFVVRSIPDRRQASLCADTTPSRRGRAHKQKRHPKPKRRARRRRDRCRRTLRGRFDGGPRRGAWTWAGPPGTTHTRRAGGPSTTRKPSYGCPSFFPSWDARKTPKTPCLCYLFRGKQDQKPIPVWRGSNVEWTFVKNA